METIFFLHFLEISVSFFRLVEEYFSTKSLIPAGGKVFSGYWGPFAFAQSFFLSVETVTENNGS